MKIDIYKTTIITLIFFSLSNKIYSQYADYDIKNAYSFGLDYNMINDPFSINFNSNYFFTQNLSLSINIGYDKRRYLSIIDKEFNLSSYIGYKYFFRKYKFKIRYSTGIIMVSNKFKNVDFKYKNVDFGIINNIEIEKTISNKINLSTYLIFRSEIIFRGNINTNENKLSFGIKKYFNLL